MRNAWRSILTLRTFSRIASSSSHCSRIGSPSLRALDLGRENPSFLVPFAGVSPRSRWFSSEAAFVADHVVLGEAASKPIGSDEIRTELELLGLALEEEAMDAVLEDLKCLQFVWQDGRVRFGSVAFNQMLRSLGSKGRSEEFWRVVAIMKKKGFGISKETYLEASSRFEDKKKVKDLDMLKQTYSQNTQMNAVAKIAGEICKILRKEESNDAACEKLNGLDFRLSSDLVAAVLEKTDQYPKKAFLFLRWVEADPSFKMDGRAYNMMARILGREDCINEFQDVLSRIRNGCHQLEKETYVKVSESFLNRKMITEAVDLYEFAMGGLEKPSPEDFMFLLRKIVVSKDPYLNLVTRVVHSFVSDGNSIKRSVFVGILKSLSSVGRLGECDKVLKAMEEGGFSADSSIHDRVVIGLCDTGMSDKALEYLDNIEKEGYSLDAKTWAYLVQKHSVSGELEKALGCLNKMIERRGGGNVGSAFDVLAKELCHKNRAKDVYKIVKESVTKRNVQPWHSTYKLLIGMLINQGCIKEASSLLGLMKSHGFPPFIDPFIEYLSKSGSADDAMGFLKAMTVKEFPSKTVFLRVFETLLKAGRHEVAHGVLSKSPGSVRNHADVLDLFHLMKPNEATAAAV